MNILKILVLAIVQGAAELLPVSSSAHVIAAEKLMGLDPTTPQMTFLLVMLHTGTMFAVIAYFWRSWQATYFQSAAAFRDNGIRVALATALTGVVGVAIMLAIKHALGGGPNFEVESLFGNSRLIATALACAGLLIIAAARRKENPAGDLSLKHAAWIGVVQGLCLPFRGFSRSGATISTGLLLGIARRRAEEFSFALAVVLTPVAMAWETRRLFRAESTATALTSPDVVRLLGPGAIGMLLSFGAGWLALRWLSAWLEKGRWQYFGWYCLLAAFGEWFVG